MNPDQGGFLASVARRLLKAETTRKPIEPISSWSQTFSMADAYAVQGLIVAAKQAAGEQLIGWKAGFTSRAMQEQLGIREANYGRLFESMLLKRDLVMDELIHPRVEPEIAFVMKRDLSGPAVSPEEALGAVESVVPCIEIVDSRIKDYRFQAVDNTADNSSAARLLLGNVRFQPAAFDLRLVGVVLERSNEVLATGAGAAALGHPARSLAWLTNKLAESGQQLKRGEVVITGGLTAAPLVDRGDEIAAVFDRLGEVRFRAV